MVGASLTGTAVVRNLQNRRFPRLNKNYDYIQFSDRVAFLAPLVGEPWAWQSRNCWDFACHVQRELFDHELPRVAVPADLSKRWVLDRLIGIQNARPGSRYLTVPAA
jgi:hypothetical protein